MVFVSVCHLCSCIAMFLFIPWGFCDDSCDCNIIHSLQDHVQRKLWQLEFENSKLASRVKRLEGGYSPEDNIGYQESSIYAKLQDMEERLALIEEGNKEATSSNTLSKNEVEHLSRLDLIVKHALQAEKKSTQLSLADMRHKIDQIEQKITDNVSRSEELVNNKLGEIDKKLAMFGNMNERLLKEEIRSINESSHDLVSRTEEFVDNKLSKMDEKLAIFENTIEKELKEEIRAMNESSRNLMDINRRHIDEKIVKMAAEQTDFVRSINTFLLGIKVEQIAFTATGIKGVVSAAPSEFGRVTFPNVIENIGSSYESSTGMFTCGIPGIYHFVVTVSINREIQYDWFLCALNIQSKLLHIYANKHDHQSYESYPATLAATAHLNVGDPVYVSCKSIDHIYNGISTVFTGFLVNRGKT